MSDATKTYEGMFLVDAGTPDFHAASEPARALLQRCNAEILAIKPWDERRLAYEIRGRRRGLYILTYFKANPERIAELERDSQLDERVLRLLILRRDNLTEQQINADTPATASARRAEARKAAEKAALPPEAGEEGGAKPDEKPPKAEAPAKRDEKAAGKKGPAEAATKDEPAAEGEPAGQPEPTAKAEPAAEAQDAAETGPAAGSEPAEPAPPEEKARAGESGEKPGSS